MIIKLSVGKCCGGRHRRQFFLPLTCVNICIQYNKDGRPSGDADVDFTSHEEAQEAMRRNKASMRESSSLLSLHSSH